MKTSIENRSFVSPEAEKWWQEHERAERDFKTPYVDQIVENVNGIEREYGSALAAGGLHFYAEYVGRDEQTNVREHVTGGLLAVTRSFDDARELTVCEFIELDQEMIQVMPAQVLWVKSNGIRDPDYSDLDEVTIAKIRLATQGRLDYIGEERYQNMARVLD